MATDGNGNVRTNQYSVPTTGVVQNYEHDLNGNTWFEKTAAGVVVWEFQWDQQGRLKVIDGLNDTQFTYDGASRRLRIRELASSTETSNKTARDPCWSSSSGSSELDHGEMRPPSRG